MHSNLKSDKKTDSTMKIGIFLTFLVFVVAENMYAPPIIDMDQQKIEDILSPFFSKEVITRDGMNFCIWRVRRDLLHVTKNSISSVANWSKVDPLLSCEDLFPMRKSSKSHTFPYFILIFTFLGRTLCRQA